MSDERQVKLTPSQVIAYYSAVPASKGDCFEISYINQAVNKALVKLFPELREAIAVELEGLGFNDIADRYRLQAFESELADIEVGEPTDGGEQ